MEIQSSKLTQKTYTDCVHISKKLQDSEVESHHIYQVSSQVELKTSCISKIR